MGSPGRRRRDLSGEFGGRSAAVRSFAACIARRFRNAACNCPCSAGRSQNVHRSPPEGCIHDRAPPATPTSRKGRRRTINFRRSSVAGENWVLQWRSRLPGKVQPTDSKPLLKSHGELTSLTHSKKKPIVQPRVPEVRKFVKKKPEAAPRVRRVPPPPRSSTSQLPRPGIVTRTIGTSGPNVYVCIYKDTCWRCSSRGHSAASCKGPWMKFCSHCGLLGVFSKYCACQRYRAERGPKPNTKSIGVQCELRSPGWMPPMPDLRLRPVQRQ
ncbi:hypothetical protein WA026_005889 [Henosepilachna vigintioctopunctata]|uniref:CCHC-type domain-containing protein n=1 Tax=Henosepilachna vigintioctopunctata TaxID=420089 RepID=A0AAW1U359_9CUCU